MGGYQCQCKPGYVPSSKFACAPPPCRFGYLFNPSLGGCADVNECSSGLHSKYFVACGRNNAKLTFQSANRKQLTASMKEEVIDATANLVT